MNKYRSRKRKTTSRKPVLEIQSAGVLELHPKGYGFLRKPDKGLRRTDEDVFVSAAMIQKLKLQQGSLVTGLAKSDGVAGPRLKHVETIEGLDVDEYRQLVKFEDRTPINPTSWLQLERAIDPTLDESETATSNASMRVLDLLCPIGLGQRALIASPPRAGKTTLLKHIGRSISANHPHVELVALLIDERPEEVTDMKAEMGGNVFASCLDHTVENHARLSRLIVDRCKRIAESGKDVFLLVDSLTRMARAFNKLPRLNGPVGAGGLNIRALEIPKQVFSAARQFKEGGSLTIVASVLIETENRMDEVIFQEFRGTGNLDLVLSQQIANQGVWPAIDIGKSGTRRVELLQDGASVHAINTLRRSLLTMEPADSVRELIKNLGRFETNAEFLQFVCDKILA